MAHGQRPLATLLKDVRPEAADTMNKVGKICFSILVEGRLEMRRNDVVEDVLEPFCGRERRVDYNELAADADHRRVADFEVNIGGVTINGRVQNLIKNFHAAQTIQRARREASEISIGARALLRALWQPRPLSRLIGIDEDRVSRHQHSQSTRLQREPGGKMAHVFAVELTGNVAGRSEAE